MTQPKKPKTGKSTKGPRAPTRKNTEPQHGAALTRETGSGGNPGHYRETQEAKADSDPFEEGYARLLARRVPVDAIEIGRAYVILARRGSVGVAVRFDDDDGHRRLGYRLHRKKWGDHYLFTEWDWSEGEPHGTAIPLRAIEAKPPKSDTKLLAWLREREVEHREEIRTATETVFGERITITNPVPAAREEQRATETPDQKALRARYEAAMPRAGRSVSLERTCGSYSPLVSVERINEGGRILTSTDETGETTVVFLSRKDADAVAGWLKETDKEVRARLGLARKYTFDDIRRALYADGPPPKRTLKELKESIAEYIRERSARPKEFARRDHSAKVLKPVKPPEEARDEWSPEFLALIGSLDEDIERPPQTLITESRFAVCLNNDAYPASLERGKVYEMVPDATSKLHGMVRVIDESGEDYLYSALLFLPLRLSSEDEQDVLHACVHPGTPLPAGWASARLGAIAKHYDDQTEDEAVAELEAVSVGTTQLDVPTELVPAVRKLLAAPAVRRPTHAPRSDGAPIYTVTVMGRQGTARRTCGWHATREGAEQTMRMDARLLFAEGSYDYAVIEEVLPGLVGEGGRAPSWFRADHQGDDAYVITALAAPPEFARQVVNWSMG